MTTRILTDDTGVVIEANGSIVSLSYATLEKRQNVVTPNALSVPPPVQTSVSIGPQLDFNLGIPYFVNEVFDSIPSKPSTLGRTDKFSHCTTNNALSTYVVSGWTSSTLKDRAESLLQKEGHSSILQYANKTTFFSNGNTQSILSILYFARKHSISLGKTLSVKSLGPTYFYLSNICDIVGVPFNMYETVSQLNALQKGENEYWLYYVCSPNNPSGQIHPLSDYPTNMNAIYVDCAYAFKHFNVNSPPYPLMSELFALGVDFVNVGFSFSKMGLSALRLGYNVLCFPGMTPMDTSDIGNCIDNSTLGFSLGLLNSAEWILGFLNDHFDEYTNTTKTLLDRNRTVIVNALQQFFGESFELLSSETSAYVWFRVNGVNVRSLLLEKGIQIKDGTPFFVSPMVGNSSYGRVTIMQFSNIIDAFVSRLI